MPGMTLVGDSGWQGGELFALVRVMLSYLLKRESLELRTILKDFGTFDILLARDLDSELFDRRRIERVLLFEFARLSLSIRCGS